MMLHSFGVYVVSGLCFAGTLVTADLVVPGGQLLHPLEARNGKRDTTDFGLFSGVTKSIPGSPPVAHRKRSVGGIAKLHHIARAPQTCQNSAYALCASGTLCCPTAGGCCAAGDCCDAGYNCCPSGACCPGTHDCVTVNGVAGCCPKGKTCSSGGSKCADDGFVLCANENFCCPSGLKCYRDAQGKASCGDPPAAQPLSSSQPAAAGSSTRARTSASAGGASVQPRQSSSAPAVVNNNNGVTTSVVVVQASSAVVDNNGLPTTMVGYNPISLATPTNTTPLIVGGQLNPTGRVGGGNTGTTDDEDSGAASRIVGSGISLVFAAGLLQVIFAAL